MTRGRRISDDLRHAIISMSEEFENKQISRYLGVSLRSVQRIVAAAHSEHGSQAPTHAREALKSQVINDDVIRVCFN